MQIERTSRRSTILSSVAATSIATKKLVLILLLYTVVLAGAGAVLVKSGMIGRVIKPALFEGPVIAYNYLRGQTTQPERMVIDVKHKHFQKLAYNREIAVQRMHLFPDYRDEVPAVVRYGDTQTRVKMRLKGGGRDHFLHKYKWSFRIQTRGEQTLFGMKRFSIQQPKSRNYVYEWLFHEVAKREGLLALRYYFIEVVLNGKNLGVYALEEHFDKRLLEHNGRREGPIIKFDETNWQMERMHFDYANWRELPESGNYYSLPIDMFMTNTILADSTLSAEFGVALNLLERFRLRELRTSQIFDVDRLAKYLALCDLFGTHHPLHTNQLRFYYNPITSRLEPICFDTNSGNPAKKLSFSIKEIDDTAFDGGGRAFVLPNMFEDPEFFEAYVKALERFSERTYLDTLLHDFGDELQHNVRVIHREFPRYRFSPTVLYHNQEYIKTFLSPSKGLHAHFAGSDQESIKLEVANIQQIPIELLSVSFKDSLVFPGDHGRILSGTTRSRPVEYHALELALPAGFSWTEGMIPELRVNYRLLGTERICSETVFSWSHLDKQFVSGDFLREAPNIRNAQFATVDDAQKAIFLERGEWALMDNLIIPAGYRVIAGPGLTLNLYNGAKILSYSPLIFVGSEEEPVIVMAPDSTGQGLVVMNAHGESVLKHVRFINLSSPAQNGWGLTGAVTFYESPVRIAHTHFAGNRAEDALNTVRSTFVIENTLFSKPVSDAFDADFCTGRIVNTSFVDCVNDAIDVSGSDVRLDSIFVSGAGDKGVSAGENSRVEGKEIEIRSASIGVASKDLSQVTIDDVRISNTKFGLAAFQKKAEFGGAIITARRLNLNEVLDPYIVETNSRISVDGAMVGTTHRDAKSLLYPVE